MEYKQIRAIYDENTIRVYQAYSEKIAKEAVENGTFGSQFKMERMTWIKPSFLWMMYRCGWASKSGQERVLAINIKREDFDYIVKNAVMSHYDETFENTRKEWKMQISQSDIRCQWDPERDVWGNPLDYRSIQLGLRGQAVKEYVNNWIVSIEDITDYVKELDRLRVEGKDIMSKLPQEKVYKIGELYASRY